jgi:hypothetical protein
MGRYNHCSKEGRLCAHLLLGVTIGSLLSALLLLALALLEQSLRHQDLILGRDAPAMIVSVGPLEHVPRGGVWLGAKNCGTVVCWLSCILR